MNKEWIGCASNNFRPGRPVGQHPEAIVIHVITGSLKSADGWFNNPVANVSAHYGVGIDGQIHQYVAETDTAYHAGIVVNPTAPLVQDRPNLNPNFYTIGVEHEGQPEDAWTEAQATASAALIVELAQRWSIPLDGQHIIAHHQIRASKTCPGNQQKVDELIRRAQATPVQVGPGAVPGVCTVANVRIRRGAPSTLAPIVKVIPADTMLQPAGFVTGESVQGNCIWYRDGDGNFFWAGATDSPNPTE